MLHVLSNLLSKCFFFLLFFFGVQLYGSQRITLWYELEFAGKEVEETAQSQPNRFNGYMYVFNEAFQVCTIF